MVDYAPLTAKKAALDALGPLDPALIRNLDDWFRVELTYTSNALEGNTLTRAQTALVLDKGLTAPGKTLTEHLEARGHARALDWARGHAGPVDEAAILRLHAHILAGIDDANAGRYRSVPVRIAGSATILPNPRKVPDLMAAFGAWLAAPDADMHPVALAGEAHYRLVTIHPFTDGNGRTARLLMTLLLARAGYPPALIGPEERLPYIEALEAAQTGGSRTAYDHLIARAAERSLDIMLEAARGAMRGA
jgi:Fic family protein